MLSIKKIKINTLVFASKFANCHLRYFSDSTFQIMPKLSTLLWERCKDWALATAVHPFVLSLLRGTLSETNFKAYIAQDAFFLRSFGRSYERAVELCRQMNDEFGRLRFSEFVAGIENEIRLHAKYAETLSIDINNISPFPQTVLYTDFLDQLSSVSVARMCASLAACMRLYAYIAKRGLQHNYCEHLYSSWVYEYSSPEFQSLAQSIESLLDHYAEIENLNEETLYPHYEVSLRLELGFFSALGARSWNGIKPSMIFIDFDKTITKMDTITPLVSKSLELQNRNFNDFKILENNYINKFNQFLDDNLPQTESPIYNKEQCDLFLTKLTEFDKSMLANIEDAKVTAGITTKQLKDIGKDVGLLPSSDHLLNFMLRRHAVNIVSLNWSSQLIRSSLERVHCHVPHQRSPTVYANDLIMGSEGRSNGMITRLVSGANDKLDLMKRLIDQQRGKVEATTSSAAAGPTVFIGDSLGDLAALLGADLGIIVGSSSTIARAAVALGIVLKPVDDIVRCTFSPEPDFFHFPPLLPTSHTSSPPPPPPSLYVAETWSHLGFCMYGKHYYSEWISLNSGNRYFPFDKDSKTNEALVIPRVLTIGASDSGGGAGIQAALRTCDTLGAFGMTALTAVTAQNTKGITAYLTVDRDNVWAQLKCVLDDIGADTAKAGIMPTAEIAYETMRALVSSACPNILVDPVMTTSSGSNVTSPDDTVQITKILFPPALLVTPNVDEARVLLNLDYDIHTVEEMENAAKELFEFGPGYVLIKGGLMILDANRTQITSSKTVIDVLYDGISFQRFENPVIKTRNIHGAGCTLGSAINVYLARGMDVPSAIRGARRYVQDMLERSAEVTMGGGVYYGPMLHLAQVPPFSTKLATDSVVKRKRQRSDDIGSKRIDLSAYVVTDQSLNQRMDRTMEQAVTEAVRGGATVVQLREKNVTTLEFCNTARRIHEITSAAGIPLLINDRVDVALAIGADGVHLGQGDMSAVDARRLLGPACILGVSCRTVEEALKAAEDGADYIGVGAVYQTSTKTDTKVVGLTGLREITSKSILPVVAIGGIGLGAQIVDAIQHGADGVAVVSAVFGAKDIQAATKLLVQDINRGRETLL